MPIVVPPPTLSCGCRGWEHTEQSPVRKVYSKGRLHFSWGSHHLLGVPKAKAMVRGHAGAADGCGSHGHVLLQGHRWAAPTYLPKTSRLRNPSNCSFPFLSTQKEVKHPEAASLGMQREQDPSSWLHSPAQTPASSVFCQLKRWKQQITPACPGSAQPNCRPAACSWEDAVPQAGSIFLL